MKKIVFLLFCLSATSSLDYFRTPVKPCHIGDVVQNKCLRCLCTSKSIFECLAITCDEDKITEDRNRTSKEECIPFQLYAKSLVTCICNKDGKWPHQSCFDTFLSLPPSNVQHKKCDPDTYVVIECNVCRCGPDGEFISNRCTKNDCADSMSRRTDLGVYKKSNVYSNCEPKSWYSLAPCQFCYCVNKNKLVCNTGNDETKKIGVGTYDMQICGKDIINEALQLMPDPSNTLNQLIIKHSEKTRALGSEEENVNDKKKTVKKILDPNISNKDNTSARDVENTSDRDKGSTSDEYKPSSITTNKRFTKVSKLKSPPISANGVKNEEGGKKNISINFGLPLSSKVIQDTNDIKGLEKDLEFNGQTLKINVSSVLNKVFKMALRKSMVTLGDDTKCVPGTSTKNGCNTCFCMKSGRMLCSSIKCE